MARAGEGEPAAEVYPAGRGAEPQDNGPARRAGQAWVEQRHLRSAMGLWTHQTMAWPCDTMQEPKLLQVAQTTQALEREDEVLACGSARPRGPASLESPPLIACSHAREKPCETRGRRLLLRAETTCGGLSHYLGAHVGLGLGKLGNQAFTALP